MREPQLRSSPASDIAWRCRPVLRRPRVPPGWCGTGREPRDGRAFVDRICLTERRSRPASPSQLLMGAGAPAAYRPAVRPFSLRGVRNGEERRRFRGETIERFRPHLPRCDGALGVAAGSAATLLTAGHVESVRLAETRSSQAVAAYLETAWGGSETQDQSDFTRKLSLLSVYASRSVLDAVRAYQATDCAAKADPPGPCRQLWAKVVRELRADNARDEVPEEEIVELIWGRG